MTVVGPGRQHRAHSGRKFGTYAVLAAVGVLCVLFFWSQRSGPPEAVTEDATSPDASGPTAPVVQLEGGATVPADHDAVLPSGLRITSPVVRAETGTATVDYSVYPADAAADEIVAVPGADVSLVVDGSPLSPTRESDSERRLRGGPAAFWAGFDVDGLEPDDMVDVEVTARDGTSFEFVDVPVEEPVPGRVGL